VGCAASQPRRRSSPATGRPALSATEAPRFPGELPPIWNVPFHPNPFFVGRDPLLIELQRRLTAPGQATRRVVLTGLGGVGKTAVAVEYVYRHHVDYDLVWCVNGAQPASLLADLAALAVPGLGGSGWPVCCLWRFLR
jgi:hypothetical protein